ncbi:MAG: response regulator [Acidobacteria bacterium]|nr:response regulator [Acidobacteriota bacterium]
MEGSKSFVPTEDQILFTGVPRFAPPAAVDAAVSRSGWEDVFGDASTPPTVLIVDGAEVDRRLLRAMFKTTPYRFLEASRPSEAVALLGREKIDMVMLELMLPEMSGLDLCRKIKSERNTQYIPTLIVTSLHGAEHEVAGLSSGADEFLTRPLHPAVVRARVRAMLRNKATIDSLEEAEAILFALAQTVEQRDRYTGGHCQRLAAYSLSMGLALGLSQPELLALHRGAYLHDIGKIAIPDAILFKNSSLDTSEWSVMRQHPVRGEEICRPMKSLLPVLPVIRSHHERWDGTGYPDGLSGDHIPLLARILQIVDIYDALTTARPYKLAKTHADSLRIIQEETDRGWRDPELVSLFQEISASLCSFAPQPHPEWPEECSTHVSLENMQRELLK